jgi:UDP:flavonoid glycosyltransferase YjiC (YdhE family)
MKILIASTPASGHLNPLLSVGRAAQSQGPEVVALCAHALRDLIEASGAIFRAFPPVADFDLRNVDSEFPGFTDVNQDRTGTCSS